MILSRIGSRWRRWMSFASGVAIIVSGVRADAALPSVLGDLDLDGQVTVLDLVRLINQVNGGTNHAPGLRRFADVDQNGVLDSADVTRLAEVILGRTVLPPPTLVPRVDSLPELASGTQVVLVGQVYPGTPVRIDGGAVPVNLIAESNGQFFANVQLAPNRLNRLMVVGVDELGNPSSPQPLVIIQDSQPPSLHIDFPTDGAEITSSNVVVAGRVGDLLSGFLGLSTWVTNVTWAGSPSGALLPGGPAVVDVGIGQNGTFARSQVPLALGTNRIVVTAADALGNSITRQIQVVRVPVEGPRMVALSGDGQTTNVHRPLMTPLVVQVIRPDGTPFASKPVTFTVTRSDGRLAPDAEFGTAGTLELRLTTDENGLARAWWTLGGDAGCANNRVSVTSRDIAGTVFFCASANPARARQINIGSGHLQMVETGSQAPEPLRAWVSDSCNGIRDVPVTFTVTEGSGLLLPPGGGEATASVTIPTSRTGHAEVQFRTGSEAGPSFIKATFPGNPGAAATFIISAVARDPARQTTFTGLVLDNAGQPIGGAWCRLFYPGATGTVPLLSTYSDEQGRFTFTNALPGPADLNVLGSFATTRGSNSVPFGSFPALSFRTVLVPNAENSLPRPVLLPRLNTNNAVRYAGTNDLVLTCQDIAGLRMTIKASSMRLPNGTLVSPESPATVSLNQVHHDDVPMPIPDGAAPPFAWTLQPGGATFDPPIQIEYPNMSGLPAGSIAYFLSYNHDTERFEIVASSHVTADGARIVTDPGAGLNIAGWGCNCPPYAVTGECENTCKECPDSLTIPPVEDAEAELFESNPVQWKSGDPLVQRDLSCLKNRYELLTNFLVSFGATGTFGVGSAYRPKAYQKHLIDVKRAWRASKVLPSACREKCRAQLARLDAECRHGVCNENEISLNVSKHSLGQAFDIPFKNVKGIESNNLVQLAKFVGLSVRIEQTAYHFSGTTPCALILPAAIPPTEAPNAYEEEQFVESGDDHFLPSIGYVMAQVGNQSIQVRFAEEFRIANISSPDLFGAGGPGTPPDFLGDDVLRLTGHSISDNGVTYFFSEHFQIRGGETYSFTNLTFTDTPPRMPEALRARPDQPTLTAVGQTTQVRVMAMFVDGGFEDVSARTKWTVYRTSNPAIVSVGPDGLVTAQGPGHAFITAVNEGATAVTELDVVPGDPLTTVRGFVQTTNGTGFGGALVRAVGAAAFAISAEDGSFSIPNVATVFGLQGVIATSTNGGLYFGQTRGLNVVRGGVTDAGLVTLRLVCTACPDQDAEGVPDALEVTLGSDRSKSDTDDDGLSDYQEVFVYGTDVLNPDTDGDGRDDRDEILVRFTDPLLSDTDGDGWDDGVEVTDGTDPLNATSRPRSFSLGSPVLQMAFEEPKEVASFEGGVVLARPPVELFQPSLGPNLSPGGGLIMGQPPLEVFLPGLGEFVDPLAGPWLARPTLQLIASTNGPPAGFSPVLRGGAASPAKVLQP